MLNIKIDGRSYSVREGKNLLEICLNLGFDLPYFCYHPAMGSVGACRQCAVKRFRDDKDIKGRIIMACMEPVVDGMIISVEDPEAAAFRKSIIESLMLNHPHDCPVCDEGGECHLQDMTMMTGHNYRRSDKRKRTYKNQYLGPFINHEMNRCIECYRCVRFYKDYTGGKDFDVFGSHDHVYFGRHEDGMLESEFSGNLVEVCPTGVFTDKTLRQHYTRKWDLTNAPSVCSNCSVGCNIIISERYGQVRRVMSRYNGSVNGYFICDRGRFGYGFMNNDSRIIQPEIKSSGKYEIISQEHVLEHFVKIFSGERKVIGIGSPKASLEANYCLKKLTGNNFFISIPEKQKKIIRQGLDLFRKKGIHSPSLKEIEKADAVMIIGEDPQLTAPMLGLALRQASRNIPLQNAEKAGIPAWHDQAVRTFTSGQKTPFFIANPSPGKLDELATGIYRDDPVSFCRSVTASLKGQPVANVEKEFADLSVTISEAFKNASNPLIVAGASMESNDLMNAVSDLMDVLVSGDKTSMLALVVPHCNSIGLAMLDGRSWDEMPQKSGEERITAIILENDLFEDDRIREKLSKQVDEIIILDHSRGKLTGAAHMILPSGTLAETEGTFVNYEGRAQRFYRVLPPKKEISEGWRWLKEMLIARGDAEASMWHTISDVIYTMGEDIPDFKQLRNEQSELDYIMLNEKIKRQPPRFTGRTAIHANININEPKPPADPGSPFTFSMEGGNQDPPAGLVPFYWIPGWNSNQSMNFYLDELNGHMKGGDPGIRLINDNGEGEEKK